MKTWNRAAPRREHDSTNGRWIAYVASAIMTNVLTGCTLPLVTTAPLGKTGSKAVVIGGQQPVAHSTIQLYAVAATGDGVAATPLLTKTITTDEDGSFSIAGSYSCPGATEVYITAVGGNPEPDVTNVNLALMAALGPCASVNSTMPIVINELTTIAAVNALAPYMTSYRAVGSDGGDVAALDAAFTLANELVDPSTGTSPGMIVPTGYIMPTEKINTLGDILVSCINSGGGVAGDSSACGSFFTLATPSGTLPPTDTITALLYLARNPTLNTNPLYKLLSTNAPFQPRLSAAPSDFALAPMPTVITGSLQLSPTIINFPPTVVGTTSQAQLLILTNNTTAPVPISSIATTRTDAAAFAATSLCPSVLVINASCTIKVTFTPVGQGPSNALLQVNGAVPGVALSGSSDLAAPGSLELSTNNITFAMTSLGSTSQAQDVTLSNNTTSTVAISSVTISGAAYDDFKETNGCPPMVVAGASCIIQTSFSPHSTAPSSAILQINGGVLSVSLNGQSDSPGWTDTLLAANPSVHLSFNDSTTRFMEQISGVMFHTNGSAVTPRQPGFDSSQPTNTSAEFAWDGWNAAPDNTIGAIEWDIPWTMLIHVDKLNWDRSGILVLASKGDISSPANSWWELTLGMEAGKYAQLCFTRNGVGTQNGICTNQIDAMPNGFNYDIVVEDNGSGDLGIGGLGTSPALSMYINGLQVRFGANAQMPGGPFTNTYSNGFGHVHVTVSGGTGYADVTPFTSIGGGPNCRVAGFMYAGGGIPYNGNWTPSGSPNFGCTSVPTFVLTAPTGTGAVITGALEGTSMNATALPLMVPGYVSAGVNQGVAGTNSAQNPTYVDEFAIFPGNLDGHQIQSLFSQTKFYEGLIRPSSTQPPVMIFDNDAGGDMDNFFSFQMSIFLHQHGLVRLAGAVIEDGSVTCEATWRQMLDQAGLMNVPLSVPSTFAVNSGTGFCTTANVEAYDASTPKSNAAWESSTAMYRRIFAEYPESPINVVLAGPFTALAEFMESPGDSTSPMTGLQLMARNAANGGKIFAEGLNCGAMSPALTTPCGGTVGGDNSLVDWVSGQYVVENNGATPIYWMGGVPQSAGPGVFSTRNSKDPMYLLTRSLGSDMRQCYDCLAVEAVVSSYFFGGVQIGVDGGTGYTNTTYFTSTGGGQNCNVQGIMTADNGVPNGIESLWGSSTTGSYTGVGRGCTSVPIIELVGPRGTGVKLTAYPTVVCGTYSILGAGSGSISSAKCSNHYFAPYSAYANQTPVSGAPMSWFINSLVDPIP